MKLEFKVQNVKCQGCVGAIRDGLGRHAQISAVQVDIPSGLVTVEASAEIREEVRSMLRELGYPEIA